MNTLLLIDGSSLVHRAFHALPLLSNSQGEYTNAVYGFINMLNRFLGQNPPDHLVICFDKSRITFRQEIAADYKAHRKETAPELRPQFSLLKEVLDASDLPWLELEGFEGDDLLGTLARQGREEGFSVTLLSGDADLLQLVDENTQVQLMKRGITNIESWDLARLRQHYGLEPRQLIDLKALMGDASDNIHGVPGVGPKTALDLMHRFGDLDNIYNKLEEVTKDKLRQNLADNREAAFISRRLAEICQDAPLETDWQQYRYTQPRPEKLRPIYQRLGFKTLLATLTEIEPKTASWPPPETTSWPPADGAGHQIAKDTDQEVREESFQEINELENFSILNQEISAAGGCSIYLEWHGPALLGNLTGGAVLVKEKRKEEKGKREELGIDKMPSESAIYVFALAGAIDQAKIIALKEVLEDPGICKITTNAKDLTVALAAYDIHLRGLTGDIALAAYLLNPGINSYEPEDLAPKYQLPLSVTNPLAQKARLIQDLEPKLTQELAENGLDKLYREIELPLCQVLARMELAGVRVEGAGLRRMSAELQQHLDKLSSEIFALAETEFNINSPKQLGYILFEKMGLPSVKKTKTGYSTNAEVLEQLAGEQEIARKILDYRSFAKLKSTYADGLAQLITKSGKLHTSFRQTNTATGRLSSVEPNLQNIPIRLEQGRQLRRVFIPDQPDNLLLAGDYNQIELRVLAHISRDQRLIKAFIEGEDIHARTAAEVFGVTIDQVDSQMRRAAKAVNFGIVYGISDFGLARDLGIGRNEAKEYINAYFDRYPGVAQYQEDIVKQGEADGYISTFFGRRRYLPDLKNRNFNLRSFAQRMAMNTPIQGSAADIIKIAMVNIDRALREGGYAGRMILQVHDELIFDIPQEEQGVLAGLIHN
ncbi:MAG: DNA polymerase I, partial [Clostridiales bacterium]|nr:DNA polymerase I [Clostridiales bacterium]